MKRILLVCNAGMSTSLLVTKMNEAATELNVEVKIWAVPSSEALENFEHADICLVGPQIRFMVSKFKNSTDIPVEPIDMILYGRMDGKSVLQRALDVIG